MLFSSLTYSQPLDWTAEERAWGITAGTLLLSDWATTRYGTRHWDDGYRETNPTLGDAPSRDRLDLHFVIFIPVIFLTADAFPEYRLFILQAVALTELVAVGNNLHIGLKLSF